MKNKTESILENIIENYRKSPTNQKIEYLPIINLDRDYDSDAEIIEVSPSQLPEGVLGLYHPTSHTIYIANNISEYEKQFVRRHESGHALGLINEQKTDAYALSKTGYNPFPFRKAA